MNVFMCVIFVVNFFTILEKILQYLSVNLIIVINAQFVIL